MTSRITDSDFRYVDGRGNLMRSRTELSVAKLLDFLHKEYEYGCPVPGQPPVRASFRTADGYIHVLDGDADIAAYAEMRTRLEGTPVIGVGHPRLASRLGEMDDIILYSDTPQTGSIFLEDQSFSFDYAHILPLVEKCSILHGHTSSVMVEMVGRTRDNLLVDFSEAKRLVRRVIAEFDHKFFINEKYPRLVRRVIAEFDHKFFINEKYVVSRDGDAYHIAFDGPRGHFDLQMPASTTYLLRGEATVENLSGEIIRLLEPDLPDNVEGVGVYIYEGYNKGSHIISRVPR